MCSTCPGNRIRKHTVDFFFIINFGFCHYKKALLSPCLSLINEQLLNIHCVHSFYQALLVDTKEMTLKKFDHSCLPCRNSYDISWLAALSYFGPVLSLVLDILCLISLSMHKRGKNCCEL